MRWVRRGFWIAAWSAWAWLGVGLHRELPRNPAAARTELPLGTDESAFGLFDSGRRLATMKHDADQRDYIVRVWEIDTKAVLREVPLGSSPGYSEPRFSRRHAVVIGAVHREDPFESPRHAALDLSTGRVAEFGEGERTTFIQFHRDRPWALLTESAGGERVIVADLHTGHRLFEWRGGRHGARLAGVPAFLPPDDELLIPVTTSPVGASIDSRAIEIWTINQRTSPARVFSGLKTDNVPPATANGIAAWFEGGPQPTDAGRLRVVELKGGADLLTLGGDALERVGGNPGDHIPDVTISTDGRAVFIEGALLRVLDGRVLWRPGIHEPAVYVDRLRRLHVLEDWGQRLGIDKEGWRTHAVRDLGTGSVQFREWVGEASALRPMDPIYDDAPNVYIDAQNAIRPSPPPPNYSLIAICQALLALPLVLLWAVLRWRRKRRERWLAGATA